MTLLVTLTTENTHCADIMLSTAGQKNLNTFLAKSSGNSLVHVVNSGMYSIALHANSNCHYTISATSSGYRIYELTPGVFKDVTLDADEYGFFFYQHMSNTSFKMMSMSNFG